MRRPDESCARIRGHIPAASEVAGVETIGGRPATLGPPPPPPFVAGLGAAGQAAADALNRLFFLQVEPRRQRALSAGGVAA